MMKPNIKVYYQLALCDISACVTKDDILAWCNKYSKHRDATIADIASSYLAESVGHFTPAQDRINLTETLFILYSE